MIARRRRATAAAPANCCNSFNVSVFRKERARGDRAPSTIAFSPGHRRTDLAAFA
jgi:hypothetical protein